MRVLVFGTGGVGSIYAYILHKGGASVTTVCRSNFVAVQEQGITIDSALFGVVHFNPASVVRSVADAVSSQPYQPFDYIVVCSKWFPNSAHLIQPAVSAHTSIVLCQNGIGIEAEYVAAYSQNAIISGVVYLPTTQTSPGHIRMGPLQKLQIGTFSASPADATTTKAAEEFAETFRAGGGIIEVHPDIQPARWIKLAVNVAWNPICALTRCDDANFLRSTPAAETAVRAVMKEISALAAAAGKAAGAEYIISEAMIEEQLARPTERLETGGKEPSMLTDVREGRPLEAEAILGNTVRIARQLGAETPRLDLLYALAGGLSYSIKPDERWKPLGM
jgi:2-dehydropantoate 2-reductase